MAAVLNAYSSKDFDKLITMDLSQAIDSKGDTILHLIAKYLDKDSLEKILQKNPNILKDLVHKANSEGKTPGQVALESLKRKGSTDTSFLDRLQQLSHDIPDTNQFNKTISQNIKALENMGTTPVSSILDDFDKVKLLTEQFITSQKGGNCSVRTFTSNYHNNPSYGKYLNNNRPYEQELQRNEERLRNERLFGGNMDHLKQESALADKREALFGGARKQKASNWDDDIDDFTLEFTVTDEDGPAYSKDEKKTNLVREKKSSRDKKAKKSSRDPDNFDWDVLNEEKGSKASRDLDWNEAGFDEEEYDTSTDTYDQARPRNMEADDLYKSFDEKIMEAMDVDAETARIYKIALKQKIVEKNPELKKRVNDELKVKEMEKIVNNKTKLKSALKGIDIEGIKAHLKEVDAKRKEKPERKKQSRYNHNGYLLTDELILTPEKDY